MTAEKPHRSGRPQGEHHPGNPPAQARQRCSAVFTGRQPVQVGVAQLEQVEVLQPVPEDLSERIGRQARTHVGVEADEGVGRLDPRPYLTRRRLERRRQRPGMQRRDSRVNLGPGRRLESGAAQVEMVVRFSGGAHLDPRDGRGRVGKRALRKHARFSQAVADPAAPLIARQAAIKKDFFTQTPQPQGHVGRRTTGTGPVDSRPFGRQQIHQGLAQNRDHPLTAPAVRPETRRCWKISTSTISGTVTITEAAMICAQGSSY